MPRYLYTAGSSDQFWEIQRSGASYTITHGRVGTGGRSTTSRFPSEAEAIAAHDKAIAGKQAEGYVLAGRTGGKKTIASNKVRTRRVTARKATGSKTGTKKATTTTKKTAGKGYLPAGGPIQRSAPRVARNPDLEAAILADLDNPEPRLIYADWLQGQGDPRGQLIAVQIARESARGAEARRLQSAESDLLRDFHAHLVPEVLREAMDDHQQRVPERSWEKGRWERGTCEIEWQGGFIDSAYIARYGFGVEPFTVAERIEALCKHPSGRFLRELTVGPMGVDDVFYYGRVVDTLAGLELSALRTLDLAEFESEDCELSWCSLGQLGSLWPAVPNLERMRVRGGSFTLGDIDLPRIRRFAVETGGLDRECMESIARARWPQLEQLEIWFGRSRFGANCTVDDVLPLLKGEGLGRLTSLGLRNAEFTDDICRALPGSPIASQLVDLDLSMGTMSDEGASALASNRRAFPRLKRLRVADNYLTGASRERLAGLARRLDWGFQENADDWDGDRYASVGE